MARKSPKSPKTNGNGVAVAEKTNSGGKDPPAGAPPPPPRKAIPRAAAVPPEPAGPPPQMEPMRTSKTEILKRHDMWDQSLRQLDEVARLIKLDSNIHTMLRHPKRTLEVSVPVRM